ncbi:membrane-spanning 4-domains subfamily A member 12-like isoform X1 [Watersipora subatra]|uniref:membrane-spanning 4-domains subfamily A member 12-like isoform X1 n=2 Tax=Watersipora subatra TaxID=2589382 RepID=UPI00355B9549
MGFIVSVSITLFPVGNKVGIIAQYTQTRCQAVLKDCYWSVTSGPLTITMEHPPQMQQPQQPLQQPPQQSLQPQYAAQPGVTVVTQNPPGEGYKLKAAALKQLKGLSVTQVVMGAFCILFGIILIPVELSTYNAWISVIGYGIWSGVYFVLVGGIGLGAVKHNTGGWITSTMVLNIISSALFFLPLISMASTGVGLNASARCGGYYYYISCSATKAALALNILLVLISLAELVITIWSAVLCCGAVCSCCLPTRSNHYVQYAAPALQTQQQYVVYPGTVPAYQVNMGGYQVTTAGQVPTAPTLVHQQPPVGYSSQPQQPPAYYDIGQTTPHQNFQPANYPNNPK